MIERLLAPHRPALALVLLALALYLPAVWSRDLWSPDEPRYAEVVREMISRGDYILPHLNGEVYGEKPPLFFWLGAAAAALPGVPAESGPRLVSALAALATLLLTWRLGRRLFDERTGWLASLVLATSLLFAGHATAGVIDMTLTLLVTWAVLCGLRAREERSPVLWALFYVLCGLAILTKGPVGLVVPAGTLWLLSAQEDGWRRALAIHPLWGILIVGLVAAAWVAPASLSGGEDYARTILLRQNIGRAWRSWHHQEPVDYFLRVFPASFAPWVVLLPSALWGAWRERARHRGARLGLAWFVFTFVFFSLVSGKKTRYLLPLFPAASLLCAWEARRLIDASLTGLRGRWGMAMLGLAGVGAAAAGAALIAVGLAGRHPVWLLVPPGLLVACLGVLSLAWLGPRRRTGASCLLAACLILVGWGVSIGYPLANELKSARPVAEAVRAAAGVDSVVYLYREEYSGVFNVYLERDHLPVMNGLKRTCEALRASPGSVVISGEVDMKRLVSELPSLVVLICRPVGEETICAGRVPPSP